MSNISLHKIYYEMMRRCYNPKSIMYSTYGMKGIRVCDEWHDEEVFKQWANDNGYTPELRLERIKSEKDYSPENCIFGSKCKFRKDSNSQITKRKNKDYKEKRNYSGIRGRIKKEPLYINYRSMIARCYDKSHASYMNYGKRGITICDEWLGDFGFYNFYKWATDSGWAKGLTLDRIDNNKGYSPFNCRWLTRKEQSLNRRNNLYYFYNGEMKALSVISEEIGIKYSLLYRRIRFKGMDIDCAIEDIKSHAHSK